MIVTEASLAFQLTSVLCLLVVRGRCFHQDKECLSLGGHTGSVKGRCAAYILNKAKAINTGYRRGTDVLGGWDQTSP